MQGRFLLAIALVVDIGESQSVEIGSQTSHLAVEFFQQQSGTLFVGATAAAQFLDQQSGEMQLQLGRFLHQLGKSRQSILVHHRVPLVLLGRAPRSPPECPRMRRLLLLFLCAQAAWCQPAADLVLRHGAVYCLDAPRRWAQAVAVSQGRIVYVGPDTGVDAFVGDATEVLDLKGQMLLPGFCDSHVHPLLAGLEAMHCNLNELNTTPLVFAHIKEYAKEHPGLPWIVGSGWALPLFPEANPTRQQLDALVADRPVALESADGHSMWLNSKALQVCGIGRETVDPEGGRIERDSSGVPSGTLRERAIALTQKHLPAITDEQRQQGLRWALAYLAGFGITSFYEANAGPADLAAYQALERRGELTARVVAAQQFAELENLRRWREEYAGELVHPDGVKIFLDGVVEARTAALLEPYQGGQQRGELMYSPERFRSMVHELAAAGFQVHVHAIGDRAVRTALDGFQGAPGQDLRHTVAHLQLVDPADLPRFRELGVVANVQALWAQSDPYIVEFADPLLGPERAGRQYPLASLERTGAVLAGGSDWSVTSPNPLEAIEVALTRRPPGESDKPAWIPEERMELSQMLAAYTINGAYLGHREQETGSIEVGKKADLVVLSQNLFALAPDQIHTVKVVRTIFDGRTVYQHHTP